MRKLLTLLLLLVLAPCLWAQDPNFSQFFASPLTMNPALTGKFDGTMRAAINYRNQWPTFNRAFTTATASVDFGILQYSIPEIDQFGIGFMGFNDQSGNGTLKNNSFSVSTAYHKGLDENGYHQLGVGFQGTYVNKRLDITGLKFEDQLRPDGFTGLTQESFSAGQLNVSYFDANAGIFYNGTTNGENNIYAGASMYHINRHKETFNDGQYFLAPRLTLQAGGRLPMGELNNLHFSAMHSRQAGARNTTLGAAYALNVNASETTPTNLYLGSWFRVGDAVIPYVGLEFSGLRIGATYDVNVSSLRPGSNMRGGAEFSLIYVRQHQDASVKKLNCPVF